MKIPNILSIAGSDPSGGAGIQADLKTFAALGCYGMAAITSLTAQNTKGVSNVFDVPPNFVYQQIADVFKDVRVDAVKIGMLSSAEIIEAVAQAFQKYKPEIIVLDPVMVSTSGHSLIASEAVEAIKSQLLPICTVITPNIPEAEKLTRKAVLDLEQGAKELLKLGTNAAFLKGGHMKDTIATDILAYENGVKKFELPRLETKNTHGTGCTLSSALACYLAKGMTLENAARAAKNYLHGALNHSDELDVGSGHGPVHHGYIRDKNHA